MMPDSTIDALLSELMEQLERNRAELCQLNERITNDTDHWIAHDYAFVLKYLRTYRQEHAAHLRLRRKPRGNILVILSYNEPFILSIVPILNALVTGNSVHVRPSTKARDFLAAIWFESGIVERHTLPLQLEERTMDVVYEELDCYESVYFFGGHHYATELAAACGKRYISFHPEIEGADTKVILQQQEPNWSVEDDARDTLMQSMSHAGQSCQRLHGVFVPEELKERYIAALQKTLTEESFIAQHIRPNHAISDVQLAHLESAIEAARPRAVYRASQGLPIVVDSPDTTSEFVYAAFFIPTLWVIGYTDPTTVLEHLNARRYRLGLNLVGRNDIEVNTYIEKTRFSRYTVNSSHIDIRPGEGWGGLNPTGFHGYQSWIEHFSYPITVIT